MYSSGLRVYLLDNYNLVDFIVLSLYLASYMLRFLVDRWIKDADRHYALSQFDGGTARARDALIRRDYLEYDHIQQEIFNDRSDSSYSYFMKARTSQSVGLSSRDVLLGTSSSSSKLQSDGCYHCRW